MDAQEPTAAIVETPQPQTGSARLGAVWGREGRKSPETSLVSSLRGSIGSKDALRSSMGSKDLSAGKHQCMTDKRRQAAEFIKSVTGQDVPYSNDLNFRQALRDGTILCKVLGKLLHGKQYQEPGSHAPAVFLAGVRNELGVPSDRVFSTEDLNSEDYDDRPRVVDCVLFLQQLLVGHNPIASPLPAALQNRGDLLSDVRNMRDSSPRGGYSIPTTDQAAIPFSLTASSASGSPQMSIMPAGARTMAAGGHHASIANLYNTLSNGLSARLTPGMAVSGAPGAQRSQHLDHVSVVMEQFLNGLTVEYEKRLLAKDQELQASKEEVSKLKAKYGEVMEQISIISQELEDKKREAVENEKVASQERLQQLQQEIEELRGQLAEREAELAVLRQAADGEDEVRQSREQAMQAELDSALAELREYTVLKERYMTTREENRKLYNTIQDLKGSIRVFCRVRPLGTTGDSTAGCLDIGTDGELAAYDGKGERKVYRFDKVFDGGSTQAQVYEDVAGLVRSVMDGFNVCIFAYGQTGSGKTHTMTGSQVENSDGRGINYRALDDLFMLVQQRASEMDYTIQAQMVEIYNESLRDLLAEDQSSGNRLELLATQPSGLNLPGAKQLPVSNTEHVIQMMRTGARNRHSAETKMNERSSRSHQVLTIIVDGVNRINGTRTHACLHLVDLAGSERTDKSGVEGERLREANAINTSLTTLGTVMASLASKSKHVPFRDSKLTQLLADSLQGQAKVLMFMHIAPEGSSLSESISTLNFGSRVATVTLGQAKCNVESGKLFDAHEAMSKKEAELARHKELLAAAREAQQQQARQLAEQAALLESLRAQVVSLGGHAAELAPSSSCRSESFRTAATHNDTAQSTPASSLRMATSRPFMTPRSASVRTTNYQIETSKTPRNMTLRSPAPISVLRCSSGTPIAGFAQLAPPSASETPRSSVRQASLRTQQQEEEADVVGPLNSARGARPSTVPSSTATVTTSKPGRPGQSIPRLDMSTTRPSTSGASGSLSARQGARFTSGAGAGGSGAPAMTVSAAAAAASAAARSRGAVASRTSMHNSVGPLSLSRSASVVLAEVPGAGSKVAKPTMLSSRVTGGWR